MGIKIISSVRNCTQFFSVG